MSQDARDMDVRTSPAVRALLDLEDAMPDSLLEVLPGSTVPFWAQVRVQIAWALAEQDTGSVAVTSASTWSRRAEARRVLRGFLPSRWDAVRRARPHDVLFYVSGATLAAEANRARNWLVDDFAEATPGAVVVQLRPLPSPLGSPSFRPTLSMEASVARARWRERGNPVPSSTVSSAMTLLSDFAQRLGRPADAFAAIGARAMRDARLRPFQLAELERMLDRVRPRVVFYDNGSYTYNGESVGLMKDAGAYVVEPQHGWIGPSHAAYNFGRVFAHPSLARAIPDELLTFGDYWSRSVRHPGAVTAIGKPHLERQVASAPAQRPKRILVVSSRSDPAASDAFVTTLRASLDREWEVAFRPHPGERSGVEERYPSIAADPGIEIDVTPDVYESLKTTAVVVGEASTVLFEARAFGCLVIARDSAFAETVIGDAFGTRIRGVEEAVERLRGLTDDEARLGEADPDIWAPGAVETYRRWLADRTAK